MNSKTLFFALFGIWSAATGKKIDTKSVLNTPFTGGKPENAAEQILAGRLDKNPR